MANETETALASPTQPVTATTTAPAPVVDNPSKVTEAQESAFPQGTKPITVFRKMSAEQLAEIQDGFRAKLSSNPKVGHDVTLNATQPKGDTLPIEDAAPVEPAPEIEPVPTEPAPATTAPEPTPAAPEIDPETGEPVEPEKVPGRTPQQRLRASNPIDDMALTIYRKANAAKPNSMSLAQADARAREIMGEPTPDAPPVKGIDALRAELATLRTQRKEAKAAFDTDAEDTAQNAIEDKILEIERTERQQIALQQQEQFQVANIEANARAEAARLYPDLKNDGKEGRPESELHKVAREIHRQLVESGDPSVNEPDYLLDLARRAAKATSTPPATVAVNGAPKPKTVSRPSVTQPAKAPLITSGAARTSPTSQATNLKVGIQKAGPRQLEALQDKVRDLLEARRR